MTYPEVGIRCLIGGMFLISAATKLAGPRAFRAFADSLAQMRLFPAPLVRPLAALVVTGECLVCLLLAVPAPAAAAGGFVLAAVLLLAFAGAVAVVAGRGTRTPCRCFGTSSTPLGLRHVVRNVLLAAVAGAGAAVTGAAGRTQPAGLVLAALAGLLLGGLVAVLDDILGLFQSLDTKAAAAGPRGPR
ncbi:MauE/DoxX family redox-associated membrane protein [Streptomyces cinnamoneus]|uniref:Methylamine utilization protein MauE n=1 Tax=Streptomyces cinnamoneus TaxID=53446 RepID=A0A918TXV7_STRCJ|nr:MauE/DoxX family redox-associated membrane protein [Streptomyces cinnamoneus]GHC68001.1 methylamine utilization protein MauE [Streptomyces cinnamoneus]